MAPSSHGVQKLDQGGPEVALVAGAANSYVRTMLTTEAATMNDLLDRAHAVADRLAADAARHDAEGSYVTEGLEALRDAGLLTIGVPVELGGAGASPRQIAEVQRVLAHHCGST